MLSADFPAWYMVLLFAHISLTVDYSHTSPIPRPGSLIDTNLFQGDILGIDRNSSAEELTNMAKNGIAGEEYRWPKVAGKVCIPYILSKAYDEMQKSAIRTAMRFFARETCVTFIQRTTEPDYLRIYPPAITSCSSHIGRKKKEQVVLLSAYCLHRPGVIQHELMHAIGFYHEQARPDRDDYVEINKANILETDLVQFEKISSSVAFDQDYDFDSVMHYEWNDFAKNRSVWTIRSKPGFESDARFIGQRIALSQTDIRKINLMYQCEGLDLDDGPSTFTESSSSFSNSRHVDFSHSSVIMTTVSSSTSTTTTPRWAFVASSEKSSVRQGCLVNTDFWCWDTSGAEGRCVSSAWLCDGDVDCYEGSDERDCPTARPSATSTTTTTIITAATTSPVLFVRSAETHRAVVTPDKMDANVTRDRGGFLVFAQGPSLWKLPGEDVGETRELSHMSGEYSRAIAVDCVNHYLYWTNDQTGIRRSRYDGSDNHPVVTKAGMRYGLAMDFVSGNMFWVQDNAVLVAKMSHLEAGHKTIISHTEINRFSALAVHPSRGSIYWSHSGTTIETASMDGSNRQIWVTGVRADTLALDYEANDLYWIDDNTGNIECISLNGGGKRIVSAQGNAGRNSLGISLSGERIYWTFWTDDIVNSITKSGSAMKQHSLPAGRSGYLYGIVFVPEECPKLSNACAVSNGGCPFICLPLPGNKKKCVCPDGNSSCIS